VLIFLYPVVRPVAPFLVAMDRTVYC